MLDQLKKLAMQKLGEKMLDNVLSPSATNEAAEEGASGIISSITSMIGGGSLSQITDLFSGSDDGMEENSLFQDVISKFSGVLESKGMDANAAKAEATSVLPGIVSSLKEKFESPAEEDKGFDLSDLANLAGGSGGIGGLMDKAKGLFG